MESSTNITTHSLIAGSLISSIFPLQMFSQSYFKEYITKICEFGFFWNPIFWGILFPLFIIFLFWKAAKKISISLNQTSYFRVCSRFSFEVTSKILIAFFTLYIIGLFINGLSVVLKSQIPYILLFSVLLILSVSFLLMILTFISSLIIVKLNQTPKL